MNIFWSIILIFFGIFILNMTIKDGKKRQMELTTSYIMHLKGYIGGIVLILVGLIILFRHIN